MSKIELLADRCEAAVGKHCHEVALGLAEGDLECVVVNSLVADCIPLSAAIEVLGNADDNAVNQPLKTGLGIEHVVETSLEVLGCDLSIDSTLRC